MTYALHSRSRHITTLLAWFLLACPLAVSAQDSMSAPTQASAGPSVPGAINDADPESSVLSPEQAMKNPLNMGYFLMALSDRGDQAAQRGDHSKEAKYYRAIAKAVPDRTIGYRRACRAHDAAQEWDKAIEMCRAALGAGGVTVEDHLQLVRMVLKRPGTLKETDVADVDAVVERLEGELELGKDEAGRKVIAEAKCQIGAKLEDADRLETCIKLLRQLKAEPAKVLTFQWALAVAEGDAAGAQSAIEEARKAGLPAAAIAAMQRGLSKAKAAPAKPVLAVVRRWWPGAALLLVALASLLAIKVRRSRAQTV